MCKYVDSITPTYICNENIRKYFKNKNRLRFFKAKSNVLVLTTSGLTITLLED